jgi:hypothetical protein
MIGGRSAVVSVAVVAAARGRSDRKHRDER